MLQGEYKFVRAGGGKGHYAYVAVHIIGLSEVLQSETEIEVDIRSWIDASKEGAATALCKFGYSSNSAAILKAVQGVLADTSDEAMWIAGAMATIVALGKEEHVEGVNFRDGVWYIDLKEGGVLSKE